jgi:AcrR family transcriptional regulator
MATARVPRAEREAQMLEIATEVFCERGYAGAAMNEIAQRCGVTKPMLYLYFASKDSLYRACVTFVGDGLIAAIEQSVAGVDEPSEQILAAAAGLFRYAELRDRAWWGVIYSETGPADPAIAQATNSYRDRIQAIISEATARLFADPVDAEAAAFALIGAGESLLRWWIARPQESAVELSARLLRMVGPLLAGVPAAP